MIDLSDLPIFLISISSRVNTTGQYVFTGSSGATFTLPNLNPSLQRLPDPRLYFFKNRGTAVLTITPASGNIYDFISVASLNIGPGEGCVILPDNGFYNVIARSGVPKIAGASIPAWNAIYVGMLVFDTTANKLKVAGAAAWETVTSV
jgi:hypothetical protein